MCINTAIRKNRNSKGFSQDYVAAKMKISQTTYSRIESGKIKIDVDRLVELSKVLEVSPNQLLFGSNENKLLNGNHHDKLMEDKHESVDSELSSLRNEVLVLKTLILNSKFCEKLI